MRHPLRVIGAALLSFVIFSGSVAKVEVGRSTTESSSRSDTAAYVAQIPFDVVDNYIVISVGIEDLIEEDMLLDTCMGFKGVLLLDREIGDGLGLEYSGQIPLGGGGTEGVRTADIASGITLSIDGIGFPNQQILVLRECEFASDWPVEAIIGATMFDYVVEIDFENLVIQLYSSVEDMPEPPGAEFDLTFTMGIPVIEAAVAVADEDPLPVMLISDTGVSDPLLLFTYSHEEIDLPDRFIRGANGILDEGLNGDVSGSISRIAELRIGPFIFEDVVAHFPDEGSMGTADMLGQNGFVGGGILRRFTVVFDYRGRRLFLRPNKHYPEPFEWNMAGLIMGINRDGHPQVRDIIPSSPAAAAGMHADDIIIAIDGKDTSKLHSDDISRVFRQEGKEINLTIRRGSQEVKRSLTLRRLI
jgi:hypothetical protein